MHIKLLVIGLLVVLNNISCAQKESKVNLQEDFSEYYYRISHLPADSSTVATNSLLVPAYFRDLDFIDGYKIPTFSARELSGNHRNINYEGKITLLNFWFISCPPCIGEIPFLNELQNKYSDNLEVISLGRDTKSDIIEFNKKHPMDYTVIPEATNIIDKIFRMRWGYPKNILVGPDGKVLAMTKGFQSTEDVNYQKLENLINRHISK